MIRRWLAARRWRREAAALEAWMALVDSDGREVSARVPLVLLPDQPGHYVAEGEVQFLVREDAEAAAVRVTFADGTYSDQPI